MRHCLIGHPGSTVEDIKRVYSPPPGARAVSHFLSKHPEWEKMPSFDTAGSVS